MIEQIVLKEELADKFDQAIKSVTLWRKDLHLELLKRAEQNLPKINSIEKLTELAQKEVTKNWRKKVQPGLNKLLDNFVSHLDKTNKDTTSLKIALQDRNFLEKELEASDFTELEPLRDINLKDWQTLVGLSMMRREEEIFLLKKWVEKMTEEEFVDFGLTKNQLMIALMIAEEIGPLINQTYQKQMEIGFSDNAILKNPGSKSVGAKVIYEVLLGSGKKYQKKPYKEIFSETWPIIAKKYQQIARKVIELCPHDGRGFADYLFAIAEAYNGDETNFAELKKIWDRIENMQEKLADSNWPIDLIAVGDEDVTKNFNKLDVNLVIGLKTKKTKALEKKFAVYADIATSILKQHQPKSKTKLSSTSINFLLNASGSGTWWRNQGEANDRAVCYCNSVEILSSLSNSSVYQEFFNEKLSEEEKNELLEIMVLSTALHELGHTLFNFKSLKIINRVGFQQEHVELIEELKADTTGIRIFWQEEKKLGITNRAQKFLEYIIAYCQEYIRDVGDETKYSAYSQMANIILKNMIFASGIKKLDNSFEILDVAKCFESITRLSEEILDKYADKDMTPIKMADFVEHLQRMESSDLVKN